MIWYLYEILFKITDLWKIYYKLKYKVILLNNEICMIISNKYKFFNGKKFSNKLYYKVILNINIVNIVLIYSINLIK